MELAQTQPTEQQEEAGFFTGARGLLSLLILSLILSGASGLIYQVIWFRVLGLVFGVTVQATSAVLAAFMAGLALGSFIAGRYVDRIRRPLLAYALVEVGIGLSGFASLTAFDQLQPLYRWLAMNVTDSMVVLTVIRFSLAFLIMLIPTTLMGATLPLVVKSSVLKTGSLSRNVSLLYAANTLGAIFGAYSAAFYFIGLYGITVTTGIAATFNLAIGVTWLLMSWRAGESTPINADVENDAPDEALPTELRRTERSSPLVARTVLIVYGLSGLIALAYEVVWTRLLAGIFPSTVYAFAIMLCAILMGIAVGSWFINLYITRRLNWVMIFAALEGAMGFFALVSVGLIGQAFRLETWIRATTGQGGDQLIINEPWIMATFALVCIGPTAFLMGLLFPIATKIYSAGHEDVGRRIGTIYGANVLGAIIGSLGAGLLLIPLIGAQKTLWLLAAGNVALGLWIALVAPTKPGRKAAVVAATAIACLLAIVLTPDVYQQLYSTDPLNDSVVWFDEGPDATVKVTKDLEGNLVLYTNSSGQNTDAPAEAVFHYELGLLGPLLHPDPKQALVVGLGAGETAGAASVHPGLDVTVVELLPGVVEAAKLFDHVNFGLLENPRVHVVEADGRNYMLLDRKKYDVIESDPIWPTFAGAANLYSTDYYRLAKSALKDDGIMVQWVDTSLPEPAYKMMVRSFVEVFPNATMWFHGSVLVGTPGSLRLDYDAIEGKFKDQKLRETLDDLGLRGVNDIMREFVARPEDVKAYLGPGPVISDRNPAIEYIWSLPSGTAGADLRWRRVGAYVAAREGENDGIIFSDGSVKRLFRAFHPTSMPDYTPLVAAKGNEEQLSAALNQFFKEHDRVWFVPWWFTENDQFFEKWLNVNTYQVQKKQIGNLRVSLYVSPQGEPALTKSDFNFGDTVRIEGYSVDKSSVEVGGILRVALQMQAMEKIDEDVKVLLRLVDSTGRTIASVDRLPRDFPTSGWGEGVQLTDRIGMLIPPGTPAGTYKLDLDMYRQATGERLTPANPNAAGKRVILGQVQVQDTGRQFSAEAVEAQTTSTATFDDVLRLAGFTVDTQPRRPGEFIDVNMFWQPLKDGATRNASLILGKPETPLAKQEITVGRDSLKAGTITRIDGALRVLPDTPEGRYDVWLQMEGSHAAPEWLGRLDILPALKLTAPAAPASAINAPVGDWATLAGATVNRTGEGLKVTLVWQAIKDQPQSYTVFVHLLDSTGNIIAQSDQTPAAGAAPTSGWSPGEKIGDEHTLVVNSIPAGSRLIAGMYDPGTGKRVSINGNDTVALPAP